MTALCTPISLSELVELVRSTPRLLAVGAQTKPRLSAVDPPCALVSLRQIRGIVEYEPDEFTITALAGTPVSEIAAVLAERGQSLPFDPMLIQAGSTLGGTVAAGLNGPGRFRFGGVRDFILGVRFVDGGGRLLKMGGKVVKNAAGFDLPKFFVGSLGRFGVLGEVTLKVFPHPADSLTVRLAVASTEAAAEIFSEAGRGRWEAEALDLAPSQDAVYLRLSGPGSALTALATEILSKWPGHCLPLDEAAASWTNLTEFHWAQGGVLVKVVLDPGHLSPVLHMIGAIAGARAHVSAGGNVGYVSLPGREEAAQLDAGLRQHRLPAVVLRGPAPLWLGAHPHHKLTERVKAALDPQHRFPTLDE